MKYENKEARRNRLASLVNELCGCLGGYDSVRVKLLSFKMKGAKKSHHSLILKSKAVNAEVVSDI